MAGYLKPAAVLGRRSCAIESKGKAEYVFSAPRSPSLLTMTVMDVDIFHEKRSCECEISDKTMVNDYRSFDVSRTLHNRVRVQVEQA